MLTGCSGIGKTTLAKHISEKYGIPFISGSYSDLVPSTKDQPHKDMITKSLEEIRAQDYQVVNLRSKHIKDMPQYVTDRSYTDSIAYWLQKLGHQVPECDTTDFVGLCTTLLLRQCDAIIYIPFTTEMLEKWEMEDNNKRVMSRWYQFELTSILDGVFNYLGTPLYSEGPGYTRGLTCTTVGDGEQPIPILVLTDMYFSRRTDIVDAFLNGEL